MNLNIALAQQIYLWVLIQEPEPEPSLLLHHIVQKPNFVFSKSISSITALHLHHSPAGVQSLIP